MEREEALQREHFENLEKQRDISRSATVDLSTKLVKVCK